MYRLYLEENNRTGTALSAQDDNTSQGETDRPTMDTAIALHAEGQSHCSAGDLQEAMSCWRQALEIVKQLDPDSLVVARMHSNIGNVLWQQGDLEGALVEYRKSLEIKQRLAPDSLCIASTYNNIGAVLSAQGDLEGALVENRKALEIRQLLAPDSLDVAVSYNNIGAVLWQQGDLEGALVVYRKALEIKQRLAPDSLCIASTYNNIGAVLSAQGDLKGALEEYHKALELRQRLASDLLDVAASYNNIGNVLRKQGDLEGALEEYQKSLEIKQRLAPDSLNVATTYENIGEVLEDQCNLEGALAEYRKALAIQRQLAPYSVKMAGIYNNIGAVLMKNQGNLDEAMKYLKESERILELAQLNLLPRHPEKLKCNFNIGEVHLAHSQFDAAFERAEDIINILPDYKWAYILKGKALFGLKRFDDAINAYDEAISRSPNYADAHVGKLEAEVARTEELKASEMLDDDILGSVAETLAAAVQVDPSRSDNVDLTIKKTLKHALSGRSSVKAAGEDGPESVSVLKSEFTDKDAYVLKLEETLNKLTLEHSELKARLDEHENRLDRHNDHLSNELRDIRVTVDRILERVEMSESQKARMEEIRKDKNLEEYFEAMLTEIDSMVTMAKAVNSGQVQWHAEVPAVISSASMAAQLVALASIFPGGSEVADMLSFSFSFVYKTQQRLEFETIARIGAVSKAHFDQLILELALGMCEKHCAEVKALPRWNSKLGQEFRKDLFRVLADVCGIDMDETGSLWKNAKKSVRNKLSKRIRLLHDGSGGLRLRKKDENLRSCYSKMDQKRWKVILEKVTIVEIWSKGKLMLFGGEEVGFHSLSRRLVGGKPLSPAYCYGRTCGRQIIYSFLVNGAEELIKYPPKPLKGESKAVAVIRELQPILEEAEKESKEKAKTDKLIKKLLVVQQGVVAV